MAALLGLGIDNAIVDWLSRSTDTWWFSNKFCKYFEKKWNKKSDVPIKLIKINNKVEIEDGNKYISIEKSNTALEIEFEINYKNQLIKNQKNKINVFEII